MAQTIGVFLVKVSTIQDNHYALFYKAISDLFTVADSNKPAGWWELTIILTFPDTSPGVSEICALQLDDIGLTHRLSMVYRNGVNLRQVPTGLQVQRATWKHVQRCRLETASPRFNKFFRTRDGRPLAQHHLGTKLRRYREKVELSGVTFVLLWLRHSFVITDFRNCVCLFNFQGISGYSSFDTVRLYTNLASADIHRTHRRYSPVGNLPAPVPKNISIAQGNRHLLARVTRPLSTSGNYGMERFQITRSTRSPPPPGILPARFRTQNRRTKCYLKNQPNVRFSGFHVALN